MALLANNIIKGCSQFLNGDYLFLKIEDTCACTCYNVVGLKTAVSSSANGIRKVCSVIQF